MQFAVFGLRKSIVLLFQGDWRKCTRENTHHTSVRPFTNISGPYGIFVLRCTIFTLSRSIRVTQLPILLVLKLEQVQFTRVLQKVLSLGSNYFSATFYQTYFYYKPSKYSPFTETHFCNLFTQSQKADKLSSFGMCWRH